MNTFERIPGSDDDDPTPCALPPGPRNSCAWMIEAEHAPDHLTRALIHVEHEPVLFVRGKVPLKGTCGVHDATQDKQALRELFEARRHEITGVAVALGGGRVVVDPDGASGMSTLLELQREHGSLPFSRRTATPRPGEHHYFTIPSDAQVKKSIAPNVDVKADGGYVLLPGAWHPDTGRIYELRIAAPAQPAPAWLLALMVAPKSEPAPKTVETRRWNGHQTDSLREAHERWLADHARTYPRSHGTCPVCDGKGAFGHTPKNEALWTCFDTDHPDTVGRPLQSKTPGYFGDALDLEAHERGISRVDVLRREGYLRRRTEASRRPDFEERLARVMAARGR